MKTHNSGFTLLEILISVTIAGAVGVLIAQVFFTTARTNTKTELLKDVKQNGEYAMGIMERMIRNSLRVDSVCSDTGTTLTSVDIVNPNGDTTTFGCVLDSGATRIASTSSSATTEYLTSSDVTIGGLTCVDAAKTLELGELLLLSHGEEASGGRNNVSLLVDSFEALLGAIYLDTDVETARGFLSRFLFSQAAEIVKTKAYVDYKSLFQEIVQQQSRVSPTYVVTKSEGPDHAKTFWVAATVGEVTMGEGKGKSKQEAEQAAAANALEKLSK